MASAYNSIALRKVAIAGLVALACALGLRAQTSRGTLRGVVEDASGARIAAAGISIAFPAADAPRTAVSDSRGEFRFDDLPPSSCIMTVTAPGFDPVTASVQPAVSTVRDLTVLLRPAGAAESVHVLSGASSITTQPLDRADAVHQGVASREDLALLPLSARSFANIAFLVAGTEPVEPSDPTKARITAVSTGGSSGLNNDLSVDGGDNSDDYIGGFLQNYSPDVIQEFAVRTAQQDAEAGGTTAGSVVIATRSGTDHFHSDLAFYERASALNARFPIENPAPDPKQPFSRQNYVATLGGPLVQKHLFFFAAAENVHENASIAYSPASTAQFDALADLASAGLIPGVTSISVPASVPVPFRDTLGSLRLDWPQSPRSYWFLRGSGDTYTTHNNLVQQGALPSTGLLTHNNYLTLTLGNQVVLSPRLLASLILQAGGLHLTQTRTSHLGFALAFPFSSTALTVSGFETFGDNQFATPITFFPAARNQQKYQFRYDVSLNSGRHTFKAGLNLIHEPVLDGTFPANPEILYQFPHDPTFYLADPARFSTDMALGASTTNLGGGFAQNVQRYALYAQDSWRVSRNLTLDYGLRYSTTAGLLTGSGRSQSSNPGNLTLTALGIRLMSGIPHDDRRQFAPRIGFAFAPGGGAAWVLRGGFGLYFNDLAQTGWATALQAVNTASGSCMDPAAGPAAPENSGCVPGGAAGGTANLIDAAYKTPYAIHISAGVQHAFTGQWAASADYLHEEGNHGYRAYNYTGGVNLFTPLLAADDPMQAQVVPNVNVFHSDNRSSYNALLIHVQGAFARRASLIANYTFAKAQTWGCVLGELFDYVNGVCDPLHPFAAGDYGPSGEDVRHRVVFAGEWNTYGGLTLSGLSQAETARPFTITTANNSSRIALNGARTSLDQFRGTPYLQTDLRIARPISFKEGWSVMPFLEFFNVFNRNNPGANYVTNISSLPVPSDEAASGNITRICTNADCSASEPIRSAAQLRKPAGALGDFFGPGSTVGAPFAAQMGARLTF